MADILKRQYAPISEAAWQEIDEFAREVITRNLAGRKVVDFNGPLGWEYGALNVGRLSVSEKQSGGVGWGVREVLPLVEFRTSFTLDMWEIDNIVRGSKDADLDPLQDAAVKAARFEDTAIFQGFNQAKIQGLLKASDHKAVKLPKNAEEYPKAVSNALKAMAMSGVGGPYDLVLGPDEYFTLMQSHQQGFPPSQMIERNIQGQIHMSPILKGGVLLSTRGGDFELTVGQDMSIGYDSHTNNEVNFFITESFIFRTLEPQAVVALTAAGS